MAAGEEPHRQRVSQATIAGVDADASWLMRVIHRGQKAVPTFGIRTYRGSGHLTAKRTELLGVYSNMRYYAFPRWCVAMRKLKT